VSVLNVFRAAATCHTDYATEMHGYA